MISGYDYDYDCACIYVYGGAVSRLIFGRRPPSPEIRSTPSVDLFSAVVLLSLFCVSLPGRAVEVASLLKKLTFAKLRGDSILS